MKTEPQPPELLWVQICEAKPNKMFTEELRQAVRFLRYSRAVPCAECGKRVRLMWTMLCEFKAYSFGPSPIAEKNTSNKVHSPLMPVCADHPIGPAYKPRLPRLPQTAREGGS